MNTVFHVIISGKANQMEGGDAAPPFLLQNIYSFTALSHV